MKIRIKQLTAFLLVFVMFFSVVCVDAPLEQAAGKNKHPALKKASASIVIGETVAIKVKNAAKGSKITYKSGNKSIAKVSQKGKVTGVKAGKTKIAVTVKKGKSKRKLNYKVTVKKPALKHSRMSVSVGRRISLPIKNKPKKSAKVKYKWSSSNQSVASVSNGTVTGKKAGTAAIKLKMTSGKKISYSSSCRVTVTEIPKRTYTVRFYSNGGSGVPSQIVEEGKPVQKPANPIRNGYTFAGWFSNYGLTNAYDFNRRVTGDLSLYAKWEEKYTVKFESNGGTVIADQIVEKGKTAKMPDAPVREGYVFEGWYADEQLNQFYNFSTPVMKNMTLYARWTDMTQHSVTFVLNDGSVGAYEMQMVEHEETAVRPKEDPTRERYRFTGWYTEETTVNEYDFSAKVTGDITLYAGWDSPDTDSEGIYNASSGGGTIYSVTGVTVDQNQVEVSANVNSSSILVVDFLSEEGYFDETGNTWNSENAEVYETVSVQTPEYCELTNIVIPFDSSNLPEHYLVRASLYNEKEEAVSEPYLCIDYTKEYGEFQNKSIDDAEFADKEVMNFDSSTTNNFGVLAEDIIQIHSDETTNVVSVQEFEETGNEENVQETEVDENAGNLTVEYKKIYTFSNPDASVASLQTGDKILFSASDSIQQYLVKIETIEKNPDGSIVVTESSDTEITDFYQFLKVEMEPEEDAPQEAANESGSVDPTGVEIVDVDTKLSRDLGFSIDRELTKHISLSGELKAKATVGIKMAYDVHLFHENYFECKITSSTDLVLEGKIEASVDNSEKIKDEIKGVKVPIPTPIAGLEVYYAQTVPIEWEISGNASLKLTAKMEEGFSYNTDSGRQDIDKKEYAVDFGFNGKAQLSMGPKFTLGVGFLDDLVTAGIGVQVGVKVSVERESEAENITNAESIHACTLCLKGEAKWFAKADAKLQYHITKKLTGTPFSATLLNFEGYINFLPAKPGKFYLSLINDRDSIYGGKVKFGGGDCENKKYRTIIEVEDTDGNALSGKPVVIKDKNAVQVDAGTSKHTSYLYKGIYVAGSTVDNRNVSKKFVVNDSQQTVKISPRSSASGIVRGNVCDAKTGSPIEGATVQFMQGEMKVATQRTIVNGSFSLQLPDGKYKVEISKDGYIPITTYETFENSGTKYMETIRLVAGDKNARGGFRGQITNAVTGDPVSDVTLKLRYGWNAPDESHVLETLTTNSDGEFSYDTVNVFGVIWGLPSGAYSLTASKQDYTTMSFNIVVLPHQITEGQNATISPVMSDDEYRIVLRWGATPDDLDSHYNAVTADGYRDHVYYSHKNGDTANLDRDDTDSYGPETITVTGFHELKNGFTYSVHDYTNAGDNYSTALSSSGAYVTLLHGNDAPRYYYVPTGRDGTVWNVFSIDKNGRITDLNSFGYAYDDEVGDDLVDMTGVVDPIGLSKKDRTHSKKKRK